jgi:hypothetical protein
MTNKNLKDTIDDVAAKAKKAAEKVGTAVKNAAAKIAGSTEKVAGKIKNDGATAGKKLGG